MPLTVAIGPSEVSVVTLTRLFLILLDTQIGEVKSLIITLPYAAAAATACWEDACARLLCCLAIS
jgi:hypothetical protein